MSHQGVAIQIHPLARPYLMFVQSIWEGPLSQRQTNGQPVIRPLNLVSTRSRGAGIPDRISGPRGTAWAVFSRIRITGLRQDPRPAGRERGLEFGYPVPPARDSASPFPERRSRSRLPRESERDPVPHSRYFAQAEVLPRSPFLRERDERFCVPESRQRYPLQREEVPRYTSG